MHDKTSEAIAELRKLAGDPTPKEELEGLMCEEDAVFSEFEAIMYRARKRVLCAPSAHRVAIYGVFLSDWDATVRRMRKNLVDMDSIRLHLERAEGGNG